jgi:hypothetical protein
MRPYVRPRANRGRPAPTAARGSPGYSQNFLGPTVSLVFAEVEVLTWPRPTTINGFYSGPRTATRLFVGCPATVPLRAPSTAPTGFWEFRLALSDSGVYRVSMRFRRLVDEIYSSWENSRQRRYFAIAEIFLPQFGQLAARPLRCTRRLACG